MSTDIQCHSVTGALTPRKIISVIRGVHTLTRIFSALWLSDAQLTHCAHFRTFNGSRSDLKFIPTSHQTLAYLICVRRLPIPRPRSETSAICLFYFHTCAINDAVVWQCDVAPNTGHEPNANVLINSMNSKMGTSGARCVPIVDLTHDDDDTNSHMSDIPLQLPASAHVPSKNSALVTFSQAGSDPVLNVAVSNRYQIGLE